MLLPFGPDRVVDDLVDDDGMKKRGRPEGERRFISCKLLI